MRAHLVISEFETVLMKWVWSNLKYCPSLFLERLKKGLTEPNSTAAVRAHIYTWDLQTKEQVCYQLTVTLDLATTDFISNKYLTAKKYKIAKEKRASQIS
jgi:hypothetical protein